MVESDAPDVVEIETTTVSSVRIDFGASPVTTLRSARGARIPSERFVRHKCPSRGTVGSRRCRKQEILHGTSADTTL